jgi:hypothetical protein
MAINVGLTAFLVLLFVYQVFLSFTKWSDIRNTALFIDVIGGALTATLVAFLWAGK